MTHVVGREEAITMMRVRRGGGWSEPQLRQRGISGRARRCPCRLFCRRSIFSPSLSLPMNKVGGEEMWTIGYPGEPSDFLKT